jgi:hypothetical protein
MTKAEYIDFIRNSLPMVDKTSRFHHEQVAAAINMVVNTVFYEMYEQNPKKFRKSMERYTTSTTADVTLSFGRYVSALTVDVVDLPKVSGGILEIGENPALGTPTTTTQFVPISTMAGEQLYGSEASLPSNVVGFSWDGARTIEYWGPTASPIANGVNIRFIKQFKSYSDTDNVVLPYGKDQLIIDKVREYLGATPPKNLVNDNADSNG